MRTHRWIPIFSLAAALAVAACGDPGEGSRETPAQQGGAGVSQPGSTQATDESDQGAGYSPERDQGTAVDDTTPHRPGSPSTP